MFSILEHLITEYASFIVQSRSDKYDIKLLCALQWPTIALRPYNVPVGQLQFLNYMLDLNYSACSLFLLT